MISKFSKDTEIILVEGLKHSWSWKIRSLQSRFKQTNNCVNDDKRITCLVYDKKYESHLKN